MNLAATVTMGEIKLTSLKISGSEGDNDSDFDCALHLGLGASNCDLHYEGTIRELNHYLRGHLSKFDRSPAICSTSDRAM